MQATENRPFRRQVFFVSGFDPRGASFLHRTCVEETQKWSAISGHAVVTGARKNIGKLVRRWTITSELPGGPAETSFDFLQWDDIIRQHWEKRNWLVYLRSIGMLWRMILDGVFFRTIRESWPIATVIAAPAVVPLVYGLGALLMLAGVLGLLLFAGMAGKIGAAAMMVAGALALLWIHRAKDQYKADWNGRICIFANRMVESRDGIAGLDARLDQMVEHIIAAIDAGSPDEALLVSHSYGTVLATIVAARVLARRPDLGARGSPFGLVTLGQTQMLSSYRKRRNWYHDDVEILSQFADFNWLDFSSPPDGACYAMVNPLDFTPNPPRDVPKMLNAQFHRGFSQEHMRTARAHRMIMHFFYMQSNDVIEPDGDLYDFVLLIAGNRRAEERYRGRTSSKPYFRKT